MDVEDFTREVKPHHRRSRLQKYEAEICDLKRQGYSDMQVRDWLAKNGLAVSRENVRKFIKRHLAAWQTASTVEEARAAQPANAKEKAQQQQPGASEPGHTSGARESPAVRFQRLAQEQRDEAAQRLFKHDKNGNNH